VRRWVFYVVFVLGDSFWRPPLVFGSIFVVIVSCFEVWVVKVFKVLWGHASFELSFVPFWLMSAPPKILLPVLLIVWWILVGRLILLRDRELASNCFFVWMTTVFLWWTGGKGCPSSLVLESGGPIAFDSRSRVNSLVQV